VDEEGGEEWARHSVDESKYDESKYVVFLINHYGRMTWQKKKEALFYWNMTGKS